VRPHGGLVSAMTTQVVGVLPENTGRGPVGAESFERVRGGYSVESLWLAGATDDFLNFSSERTPYEARAARAMSSAATSDAWMVMPPWPRPGTNVSTSRTSSQ
jgi:hypothetical protein